MANVKRLLTDLLKDVSTAPDNALMIDWRPGIARTLRRVLKDLIGEIDAEADAGPDNEELLQMAAEAQTAFWGALHDLEEAIGVDVDSSKDLEGLTVDDLLQEEEEPCE